MTKFHINKHGVPAPCRAKTGNCPLGGSEQHFDRIEDAQAYADSQSELQHGLLPGIKGKLNLIKEKISGRSYDKDLVKKNSAVENVDLSMHKIGNGIEEGFVSIEEAKEIETGYNKDLVGEQEDPKVDLSSGKLGLAEEEGFISYDDAENIVNGQIYNKDLKVSDKIENVDLRMEELGDANAEGYART